MAMSNSLPQRERDKFKETTAGKTALRVALEDTDIELGAIEIKDAATDTRAKVKTDGTDNALVVVQNNKSTTPTVYNVTLTIADTEYSQALPAGTKEFRWRCRTPYAVRFAWVTGKVATPTAPYLTLPSGLDYFSSNNNLSGQTIFLASSEAGVVVELECWT